MLFHRRGLVFGYAILLLGYLVARFVPPLVDKVILNPLILIERNCSLHVSTIRANIQAYELILSSTQSLFRALMIWSTVLIIFWGILDAFTGQLYRDYRSIQLSGYLKRSNCSLSKEEQRANWWINKSRFVKWKGQTVLIIPCIGNDAIERIIKGRCERTLTQWLTDTFRKYNWQPMTIKHSGFITFLITKTKL